MAEPREPIGEVVLYQSNDGRKRIECRFADESPWLRQALVAELFQTTPQHITLRIKALYENGEIEGAATCKEYLRVGREGAREVRRAVEYHHRDDILAGYDGSGSSRATEFLE
jgi:hypothetical protein